MKREQNKNGYAPIALHGFDFADLWTMDHLRRTRDKDSERTPRSFTDGNNTGNLEIVLVVRGQTLQKTDLESLP